MSDAVAGAYVLQPGEGRRIDLGGFSMTSRPQPKGRTGRPQLLPSRLDAGYLGDLSDAMAKGMADEEHLSEIAARHSLEVIGPVPDGYL